MPANWHSADSSAESSHDALFSFAVHGPSTAFVMALPFDVYRAWLPRLRAFYEARYPRDPAESESVYRSTIRAKALDALRGLLPAATTSNVGIYATGQAYE